MLLGEMGTFGSKKDSNGIHSDLGPNTPPTLPSHACWCRDHRRGTRRRAPDQGGGV